MKKIELLFLTAAFVMLFCNEMQAQLKDQAKIDSLLAEVQKAEEDTNKVNSLNNLSNEFMNLFDYQKARSYAEEALTLSRKIEFRKGEADACQNIGRIFWTQSNYPDAIKNVSAALEISRELADKKRMANSYVNLGLIYSDMGIYPEAVKNLYSGLKIDEEIGNKKGIGNIYNNLAIVQTDQKNFPEALKMYFASLKIQEETGSKKVMAYVYNNIGVVYFEQKNYPEAMKNYRKSLEISKENNDKYNIANIYGNIGVIYWNQENYTEALKNHFEALKIDEEINDKHGVAICYNNIGVTYLKMKNFNKANKYLNDAISLLKKIGTKNIFENCYENLADLDSAIGNFKSALENYKLSILYRDSLNNEENTKKITRQQMQYDFDKKEAATKAEQEEKDIRQRNIRYSMMGGLCGLVIFLAVAYWQRNRIKKEKKRSDELLVRSDNLLLNILPSEVAEEIKGGGHSRARTFSMVTVMFTDFKDFTAVSERVSAELLVAEIHYCFSAFDNIIQKHGIEKIKTIGDAYMCVGGMPALTLTHATDVVNAAIEIRNFMLERKKEQDAKEGISFELRLGVHTGPVVAGIVGVKKFAYDIWGDTVNIAARMEQNSEAGKINISGSTFKLVKDKFNCVYRGKIEAKNKGEVEMYFVEAG